MSEFCFSRLDQAADPLAPFYQQTATEYDAYQKMLYKENFERFRAGWERHYADMRRVTLSQLWDFTEMHAGGRGGTNMALMGPGFDVVNRDLNPLMVSTCISQLRSIIVIDFSVEVIRDALQCLLNANVDREKVHGIQYDITGGLSTVYAQWWDEQVRGVSTEEDLARVMDQLSETDVVGELQGRLVDAITQARDGRLLTLETLPPNGSSNTNRSLRLTSQHEEVPLDYVQTNMVMAGTGQTGEAKFFRKFQEAATSTDGLRGRPPSEEILSGRRQTLEDAYRIMSGYNTHILVIGTEQILRDNPGAEVHHVTDVSTVYKDPRLKVGSLSRLDINDAKRKLRSLGINLNDITSWKWPDEADHSHSVHSMSAFSYRRKRVEDPSQRQTAEEPTPSSQRSDAEENRI